MNDYSVSDYNVFTNAISTTKTFSGKLTEVETTCEEAKTIINDTAIFMGPVQENCMEEFAKINTDFTQIVENTNKIATHLQTMSDSYKSADSEATKTITETTASTTGLSSTIAAKKQQFLGNVDDPNNYDAVISNYRTARKTMTMFDNTTGEVLQDGSTIKLKPGETRVVTVKLPTNTGMINEIYRTTADGDSSYRSGKIVTGKSDIDPDPNKIDYVNYKSWSNHIPDDKSLLHNNSYDWILTANADGTVSTSQTCEYTTDVSKGEYLKAMINLNVVVESDGTTVA